MEKDSYRARIEYIGPRHQTAGSLPRIEVDFAFIEPLVDSVQWRDLVDPYPDQKFALQVPTYSLEEILAEKVRTIIFQTCRPRDLYDLWHLFGKDSIDQSKAFTI